MPHPKQGQPRSGVRTVWATWSRQHIGGVKSKVWFDHPQSKASIQVPTNKCTLETSYAGAVLNLKLRLHGEARPASGPQNKCTIGRGQHIGGVKSKVCPTPKEVQHPIPKTALQLLPSHIRRCYDLKSLTQLLGGVRSGIAPPKARPASSPQNKSTFPSYIGGVTSKGAPPQSKASIQSPKHVHALPSHIGGVSSESCPTPKQMPAFTVPRTSALSHHI